MEDGQVTLQNATANPNTQAQLCIVFNDSQAADVASYIASIETKLEQVRQNITSLQDGNNKRQLNNTASQYAKQN